MIVMKFGGTSTEDAAAMRNVLRIVRTHLPDHPVLVISAIARATNELEQIARSAALGQRTQALELLGSLRRRHEAIIEELIPTKSVKEDLLGALGRYADSIAARCEVIESLGALKPRDMDAVCSFGERMSSRIVAALLLENGIPSRWIDVCDFMRTDSNFGRARPLFPETESMLQRMIRPLTEHEIVPVTQGFIGVTAEGDYTTMGRESSDYSATVVGALLGAEKVQIWTDVDGILSADPRSIKNVRKVRSLSFEEALHLSVSGAKVLHPTTMVPVMEKNIPVQIMNSKKEGTGSLIEPASLKAKRFVKSIAHKRAVQALTVLLKGEVGPDAVGTLFEVFSKKGITVHFAEVALSTVTFVIDRQPADEGLLGLLRLFGELRVRDDLASVTLVGSGAGQDRSVRETMTRLAGEGGMVMISASGETSVTVIVEASRMNTVLQRLHKELIEETDDPEVFDA